MPPEELPDIECPRCGQEALGEEQLSVGSKASLLLYRALEAVMRRLLRLRYWCSTCRAYVPVQREIPRAVIGYHGCDRRFAQELIAGRVDIADWLASEKDYDWLGQGVYFWEHAPGRAWQWAEEHHPGAEAVVAVEIRLGRCLDLGDTVFTSLLLGAYNATKRIADEEGRELPKNTGGRDQKVRRLDCWVLNFLMASLDRDNFMGFQTIRCPFEEGDPVYPGGKIREQSHVQIAVRDVKCLSPRAYLVSRGSKQ
jgi:hypothetical protein